MNIKCNMLTHTRTHARTHAHTHTHTHTHIYICLELENKFKLLQKLEYKS